MTRKPTSEMSIQGTTSRRARLVARRHRRTRVIVILVVVAIAVAAAVSAYVLNSNDPEAHAAGSNDPKPTFGAVGTLVPAAIKAVSPRALDHAHPLNLWVGGDSLAGSFGPALGDRVGATGIVKTLIDYKTSSGLWSNDFRNWDQRAADQMASDNPDAVVFIVGTNDTPVVNNVDANGDNVPDWEADYRLKVARMMDLLVGPTHRNVIWLGPPTLGTRSLDRGALAMGQLMREEAAKRSPDVVYLDTYKLFSTSDGTFSRRISDENGKEILARISDGVHFTADGAAYLSRAVFSLLDARWELTKQADPAHPIGWNFAPGSGEVVPGYKSAPRSRYNSSPDYSSATTYPPSPETTAAPTSTVATEAPTTAPTPTTATAPTTTPTTASKSTVPTTTAPHTTTSRP